MIARWSKEWRGPRGGRLEEWWIVRTIPPQFQVAWKPDGSKDINQYLSEEIEKIRAYLLSPKLPT